MNPPAVSKISHLKAAALALIFLGSGGACAHANVRLDYAGQLPGSGADNQAPADTPGRVLGGESVYARIEKAGTSVETVFALPIGPGPVQAVYLPVFSAPGTSAATVLERSRFYAHLDGIQLTEVKPVAAPPDAPKPPAGVTVLWFKFTANEQQMAQLPGNELRISYWQPHVANAFHYLPQSLPVKAGAKRDWRFQIVIRSLISQIPALADQLDTERIGDLTLVYPRDGQIVRVRVPRTG